VRAALHGGRVPGRRGAGARLVPAAAARRAARQRAGAWAAWRCSR
jgi:hypothetical protein